MFNTQFQEDMNIAFIQERKKRAKFLAQQIANQQFGPDPSANGANSSSVGQPGMASQPSPNMQSGMPGQGIAQRLSAQPPPDQFGQGSGLYGQNQGIY